MLYPNLSTPAQYHNLMLTLTNSLMREPIMVFSRRSRSKVVNPRRYELQAKIDAASKEACERFGHKTMYPRAYCEKCGKFVVAIGEPFNPETQCKKRMCDKVS